MVAPARAVRLSLRRRFPLRSALGNFQLAPDVSAGAFRDHEGRHRLAPFRVDLREAKALARLGRVPDRDPDDLIPIRGVAFVGAKHPLWEISRSPGPTELLARARLQPPCRDP